MSQPLLHAETGSLPPLTLGCSFEITARDLPGLKVSAPYLIPGTKISITFLAGETAELRISACKVVRELGLEPVPHLAARRIRTATELDTYLEHARREADVTRCFVVAGDAAVPDGPFEDSMSLIRTGAFERCGIHDIGIGGHPDGHPSIAEHLCWEVLAAKVAEIQRRGMSPFIVTQFAFDGERLLTWLREMRARGIDAPVRLGVPGPASVARLMRFAARCGVSASASVLGKYGISITKLMGSAGPDKLVSTLEAGLGEEHGTVSLHFYPFGGFEHTVAWVRNYEVVR